MRTARVRVRGVRGDDVADPAQRSAGADPQARRDDEPDDPSPELTVVELAQPRNQRTRGPRRDPDRTEGGDWSSPPEGCVGVGTCARWRGDSRGSPVSSRRRGRYPLRRLCSTWGLAGAPLCAPSFSEPKPFSSRRRGCGPISSYGFRMFPESVEASPCIFRAVRPRRRHARSRREGTLASTGLQRFAPSDHLGEDGALSGALASRCARRGALRRRLGGPSNRRRAPLGSRPRDRRLRNARPRRQDRRAPQWSAAFRSRRRSDEELPSTARQAAPPGAATPDADHDHHDP